MRFKKRETNINLLTRQLEQVIVEDTKPEKILSGGAVRFTNDNEVKIHEAKEKPVKTTLKRGPKKDALIDTSKLLT